jgi:putative amidoligase enzyme
MPATPGCNCYDCRQARNEDPEPEPEEETCSECDCPISRCQCEPEEQSSEDDETKPGEPFYDGKARLVGVELEYNDEESYDRNPLDAFRRKWRAGDHHDGSCGREIVTAPLAGNHIDKCLLDLGQALVTSGVKADERCGVHVHVDAADLLWADMFRLLHVYAKVEPILYLIAGQHRVKNTYCAPIGEKYRSALSSVDRKGDVLNVAYNRGGAAGARAYVREYAPNKKDGGRYKGLNICPWLAGRRANRRRKPKVIKRDTTVEFRLHRNTLDLRRVAEWAKLCERIVSWCARASDAEARALPKSALRALSVIAPDSKAWIVERLRGWRKATAHSGAKRPAPRRISNSGGTWRISCAA